MKTQIRNVGTDIGPYFRGRYQSYGRYQWSIKFYGFEDEWEIEAAQSWAFGEYNYKSGTFEMLCDLIGRPIKASIQGRSGGWLVVDTELTERELKKIDRYVKACLGGLPAFLKDERKLRAVETINE